jgi:hypothetical protein
MALVHHANCRTLPAGISRCSCQILIGMSGNVAAATHPFSHTVSFPPMSATRTAKFKKTLQGLRPEPRVPSVKDICISKNMRIRKRNILTALAIMHRSASQKSSIPIMTVDVFEAKSAASKLFDKLDRNLMAPLTDASWAAASAPPRQRRDSAQK